MDKDNNKKSRKPFIIIEFFFILAALITSIPFYLGFIDKSGKFSYFGKSILNLDIYLIPVVIVSFLMLGFFAAHLSREKHKAQLKDDKKDFEKTSGKKEKEHKDRRMYLNLLSQLQKEGRLLDFLSEDLSQYEDEQIGAAVRGVHESCSKIVQKYIETEPVMKENEGEEITIEEDFDPDSIKLTGNVTGNPPFKGIIKHRGWKAKKADLPKLSDSVNSRLIVPAEIEIK